MPESVAERYGPRRSSPATQRDRSRPDGEPSPTWTISGAHPYWAYPFSDIAGGAQRPADQLPHVAAGGWSGRGTGSSRSATPRLIAVYLAQKMDDGLSLENGDERRASTSSTVVFTYLVVTGRTPLGVAKDEMAAKAAGAVRVAGGWWHWRRRRWRSAPWLATRSTPTIRTSAKCWCGICEDQIRRPRAGGSRTRRHRTSPRSRARAQRARPSSTRADLSTRQINLELRRLVYYEGVGRRHDPETRGPSTR